MLRSIVKDRDLFDSAGGKIIKTYDRNIKKLEKKDHDEDVIRNLKQRKAAAGRLYRKHDQHSVSGELPELLL